MSASDKEIEHNLQMNTETETETDKDMSKKHITLPNQSSKTNHSFDSKKPVYIRHQQCKQFKRPPYHKQTDMKRPFTKETLINPEQKTAEKQETSKKPNICIYGKNCKFFPNCRFEHPPDTIPDCRYADHCTRKGCLFNHPPGYIPGVTPILSTTSELKINPVLVTVTDPSSNPRIEYVTNPRIDPVSNPISKQVTTSNPTKTFSSETLEEQTTNIPAYSEQGFFSEDFYVINRIIKNAKFRQNKNGIF